MPLPPTPIVLEALRETVGPPMLVGVGGVVFARRAFGKSSAPFAAVVAFVAALAVGNYTATWNPHWWPAQRRGEWVPWVAAAGCLAGLGVRYCQSPAVGHSLWSLVLAVAVIRVLPRIYLAGEESPHRIPLVFPAFVLVTAAVGFGLMRLSERRPGWLTPFVVAASLLTAGVVVIHAHSKSLLDLAVIGGMGLFGISAAVLFTKGDAGPVFPGAAFLLTGVLAAGQYETESQVPTAAFVLPAVAPLLALVGLLPWVDRRPPAVRLAITLLPVLITLAVAAGLAAANESLPTGDDEF